MNYDFLRQYSIPTTTNTAQAETHYNYQQQGDDGKSLYYGQMPPQPPSSLLWSYSEEQQYPTTPLPEAHGSSVMNYAEEQKQYQDVQSSYIQTENPNRFIAPSKYDNNYRPAISRPQKRKYNIGSGAVTPAQPKKEIAEVTSDGKFVMFQGRDESYPDELNALIHPKACDLCNTTMNSINSAKDHFDSKAHDRNITAWLKLNYTDKGLNPPIVKRFKKEGPVGPDVFHCELCDLKLTSLTHANQHYAGRRHRLVLEKGLRPSGAGYVNSDGKWVRTGTKATLTTDSRFGIGEQFKPEATKTEKQMPDTTTTIGGEQKTKILPKEEILPAELHCSICNISVTSAPQMATHLEGSKHRKKLVLSGTQPNGINKAAISTENVNKSVINKTSILASLDNKGSGEPSADLSMYRTPSGSYYCKICNLTIMQVAALAQHLAGRKHLKKAVEGKTNNTNAETAKK